MPTISVRLATIKHEKWLNKHGKWGEFEDRKRFSNSEKAEKFVRDIFGNDFESFGLFPNS